MICFTSIRQGTFILLILGEAIIQLVQHPGGITLADYARGLMGFAIVFNVGDIYYQQQLLEREVIVDYTKRSPSYAWISLHMLLSVSILFFAAGIKLVYDEESGARRRNEEFLMCGFAAVSLAVIYLLRLQYKGIWATGGHGYRHAAYLFRFGMAGICALIPFITRSALVTVMLLLLITILLVLQVILFSTAMSKGSFHVLSKFDCRICFLDDKEIGSDLEALCRNILI